MPELHHSAWMPPQPWSPKTGPDVAEFAAQISIDQIPYAIAALLVRFWTECNGRNGTTVPDSDQLLTAKELATRLGVPESWVRSEERAGRIPSQRLGKYVRFKLTEVERVLAERSRQDAQNRQAGLPTGRLDAWRVSR
jgi:excisionase family DNA binding protein